MPIPEGRQLLPFYVNFRLVAFTDLPRLKPNFFPPARCAHRASHRTRDNPNTRPPAPHPRLAPLPTLASVASRATITRRSPPHRDRWRRPALRHPAQPRSSPPFTVVVQFYRRVATFTILHRFCRILHFYHFTPKVANFYRTLTLRGRFS